MLRNNFIFIHQTNICHHHKLLSTDPKTKDDNAKNEEEHKEEILWFICQHICSHNGKKWRKINYHLLFNILNRMFLPIIIWRCHQKKMYIRREKNPKLNIGVSIHLKEKRRNNSCCHHLRGYISKPHFFLNLIFFSSITIRHSYNIFCSALLNCYVCIFILIKMMIAS